MTRAGRTSAMDLLDALGRLPGAGLVTGAARLAAGGVIDTVTGTVSAVLGLPRRLLALVAAVEDIVLRVDLLADRAEALLVRAGGVVIEGSDIAGRAAALVEAAELITDSAQDVLAGTAATADRAAELVRSTATVTQRAEAVVTRSATITAQAGPVVTAATTATRDVVELLRTYHPLATKLAPLAGRFVDELSPDEVDSAIRLIDVLPALTEHMEHDILPILATLDRVGPDLRELLEVTKELRLAINGIPGFNFLRRRGADREDSEDPGERG